MIDKWLAVERSSMTDEWFREIFVHHWVSLGMGSPTLVRRTVGDRLCDDYAGSARPFPDYYQAFVASGCELCQEIPMSVIRRREFLGSGIVASLSVPTILVGCKESKAPPAPRRVEATSQAASAPGAKVGAHAKQAILTVPGAKPAGWDPVAFNTQRGQSGAISTSYMKQITAAEGTAKHLGKHLPYVPKAFAKARWQAGYVTIMFGNPELHYVRHPNAPKTAENPEGHWYNWIRIAVSGRPESEVETTYDNWPKPSEASSGKIAALEGTDPEGDGGKNTVYLVKLQREPNPAIVCDSGAIA